jgi:hypothetical protein
MNIVMAVCVIKFSSKKVSELKNWLNDKKRSFQLKKLTKTI